MPSENGDIEIYKSGQETDLILLEAAVHGREIRHKDTTDDEIKECLKYAMALTGIRANNLPVGEEKALLINFLKRNFGSHTCNEIRLAFEMAIAGKFNIDTRCFENFSCEYVARIMEAYREWAAEEIKFIPSAQQNETLGIEMANTVQDWSGIWEELLKKGAENVYFIPVELYDWLEKQGKLNLSVADKWHYVEEARYLELAELRLDYNKNRDLIMLLSGQTWKKSIDAMSRLNPIAKQRAVLALIKDIQNGKIKDE